MVANNKDDADGFIPGLWNIVLAQCNNECMSKTNVRRHKNVGTFF